MRSFWTRGLGVVRRGWPAVGLLAALGGGATYFVHSRMPVDRPVLHTVTVTTEPAGKEYAVLTDGEFPGSQGVYRTPFTLLVTERQLDAVFLPLGEQHVRFLKHLYRPHDFERLLGYGNGEPHPEGPAPWYTWYHVSPDSGMITTIHAGQIRQQLSVYDLDLGTVHFGNGVSCQADEVMELIYADAFDQARERCRAERGLLGAYFGRIMAGLRDRIREHRHGPRAACADAGSWTPGPDLEVLCPEFRPPGVR
ncbi:MAG TPA: hypothetical protein VK858_05540 [Longimicrobiales bacterium]|nr:hypothetical protein [Longimicrobiales bacterium]